MPEFHAEPYLFLPTVTHKSAMVAWGAFYFRVTPKGKFKLVDDSDLKYVHPPRRDSIGACSAPYGPARVEVYDKSGALVSSAQTLSANHCWLTGLSPTPNTSTTCSLRVMFSGHEHNFQHSRADGIDYFVTGAAGRFRAAVPDRTDEAHTLSWSADCHFLLVRIDDERMVVRAIGETPGVDIGRVDPAGKPLSGPMEVRLELVP